MRLRRFAPLAGLPIVLACLCTAAFADDLAHLLETPLLDPGQSLHEAQQYAAKRVPSPPRVLDFHDWERQSASMRQEALDRVMLAGQAARWRRTALKVEWQDTLPAGDYHIRKLRYEALPGMWVPALLYEPTSAVGQHPGVLNFNGHDPAGKAARSSQILCINLAKRGVSVLNVEWFGTGQLVQPDFGHGKLNQIDLTGTSGIAPFYLATARALEVLIGVTNVDASRIAAVGFDGGGWQAVLLGALDPRVEFVGSVAGYASLHTALQYPADLRDVEYLPYDLCTVGDYLHFTLMLAPRPLLLIYNSKDPCCFASDRTLGPLAKIGKAFYGLADAATNFQWFINEQTTEHNLDEASRTRLYQAIGKAFGLDPAHWPEAEIPCEQEVRDAKDLSVAMPAVNETFHSLAEKLAEKLPLDDNVPHWSSRLRRWQAQHRLLLSDLVRAKDYTVRAESVSQNETNATHVHRWRLHFGEDWTAPVVEFSRGSAKATAIVLADQGRSTLAVPIDKMLAADLRVLAMDPLDFGETALTNGNHLLPLLISALGDRPLGVQAGQVAAAARWVESQYHSGPVVVAAYGPRTSLIALVAAGLEQYAIGGLELHHSWPSLKHLITADMSVEQAPEAFCPGLLGQFDIPQLEALVEPRPIIRRPEH